MGFSFIVVTNQSGIARGIYNIDNYHHLNNWMIGDKEVDITAARESGIYKTILVRSGHDIDETLTKASFVINSIEDIKEIIY